MRGYSTLRKKDFKCSKNQFTLLHRNPLYAGCIVIPAWREEREETVMGIHEPLVSWDLFQRVQVPRFSLPATAPGPAAPSAKRST